jgi:RHS repeat-associated protein
MRINISGGSNTLYYLLKDHLGSASVVTDASGTIVGEDRFYPYGETRFTTGTMYTDQLFTGQREMTGLGIYHYGARFYSPKLGRFLSPDTIIPGTGNPQAFNRYSYVLGNPLKYIDPSGHSACQTKEECEDMGTTPTGSSSSTGGNSSSKPKDPHEDDDADTPDLLDLSSSPLPCEWIDCVLAGVSLLASVFASFPVPEIAGPAVIIDLGATTWAGVRTGVDWYEGKIGWERGTALIGTGLIGLHPSFIGIAFSYINLIITGSDWYKK